MDPLISILMPVRNGLPYLIDTLESILLQSHVNLELIAIDDHSTDETPQVLSEYTKKDARVQSYTNNGNGIIDALSMAFSLSQGEYITRMDADDIMPKEKLQKLLKALIQKNNTVSTGYVKYFSEQGVKDGYLNYETWLNGLCDQNNHFSEIYRECVIPSPCWMMKRSDLLDIGGFATSTYPEDYDLAFRMYQHRIKVVPVREVLHLWRDHDSRASRNDPNYADNRFLDIKMKYFKEIECPKASKIVLIGAGKKGKQIAKSLLESTIPLEWVTNNINKIGRDIYGNIILDYESYLFNKTDDAIYLLALGNNDDQNEALNRLKDIPNKRIFLFS